MQDFANLSLAPSAVEWRLFSPRARFLSPFTGSSQQVLLGGSRWRGAFGFEALPRAEAQRLSVFLASLAGKAFLLCPPIGAGGTPRHLTLESMDATTGTATATIPEGVSPFTVSVGDWLSLRDSAGRFLLHRVNFIDIDQKDKHYLRVAPPWRQPLADNSALEFGAPCGQFRLADDEVAETWLPGFRVSISFNFEEAI